MSFFNQGGKKEYHYNVTQSYLWTEEKSVNQGSSTLSLTNTYNNGEVLMVIDKKYNQLWIKDVNFTVSGNVITLTKSADEKYDFIIVNLG